MMSCVGCCKVPSMPIQTDARQRGGLRQIASLALTIGAASVGIIAVGVVIGLFVWVYSLPDQTDALAGQKVTAHAANPPQKHGEPVSPDAPAARNAGPSETTRKS